MEAAALTPQQGQQPSELNVHDVSARVLPELDDASMHLLGSSEVWTADTLNLEVDSGTLDAAMAWLNGNSPLLHTHEHEIQHEAPLDPSLILGLAQWC